MKKIVVYEQSKQTGIFIELFESILATKNYTLFHKFYNEKLKTSSAFLITH